MSDVVASFQFSIYVVEVFFFTFCPYRNSRTESILQKSLRFCQPWICSLANVINVY